jgi:ABC-type nitrate/sulfonate/bicarbonate transport system substrate-binding protein
MQMTRRTYIVWALSTLVLLGGSGVILRQKADNTAPHEPDPGPAQNAIYAAYKYEDHNTINVGTQPLFSPTGLISEAMQNDLILEEELRVLDLRIRFHPFLKGYDVNYFLSRGFLQVGIGGDMPTLTIAATSEVVIALRVQNGLTWLVGKQPFLLRDLKGKRIGYANGSNAHFMLLNLLSSVGLSQTDVYLVPMSVGQMPGALAKGGIDVFAAWEPAPSIAKKKYGFVRSFGAQSSGYMYFGKDFADKHPKAARAIVAAATRAIAWLGSGKANRLIASQWKIATANVLTNSLYPISTEEDVEIAEEDFLFSDLTITSGISDDELSPAGRLAKEYAFLQDIGKIEADIPWEKVRDSFNRTIFDGIPRKSREYRYNMAQRVTEPDTGGSKPYN